MIAVSKADLVNQAIADAKTLPQLIANLPPDVAIQLEAKPLIASRTVYGTFLATLIGLAAAKYGLGFDTQTDQLLAGGVVLVATTLTSAVLRMMTKQPIAGLLNAPVTPSPAP